MEPAQKLGEEIWQKGLIKGGMVSVPSKGYYLHALSREFERIAYI
jgi:hypothetical protein